MESEVGGEESVPWDEEAVQTKSHLSPLLLGRGREGGRRGRGRERER